MGVHNLELLQRQESNLLHAFVDERVFSLGRQRFHLSQGNGATVSFGDKVTMRLIVLSYNNEGRNGQWA